jgi:hypothetical protein
MKQFRALQEQAALWRDKKAERLQEFEALQVAKSACCSLVAWREKQLIDSMSLQGQSLIRASQGQINGLQARMGRSMPQRRTFHDLTCTELERLSIEIVRLQDEYLKRMHTLETAMTNLRTQCEELGEDADSLAAGAHESLGSFRHASAPNISRF